MRLRPMGAGWKREVRSMSEQPKKRKTDRAMNGEAASEKRPLTEEERLEREKLRAKRRKKKKLKQKMLRRKRRMRILWGVLIGVLVIMLLGLVGFYMNATVIGGQIYMLSAQQIDLRGRGLSSIGGLKRMTGLDEALLSGNRFEDVSEERYAARCKCTARAGKLPLHGSDGQPGQCGKLSYAARSAARMLYTVRSGR